MPIFVTLSGIVMLLPVAASEPESGEIRDFGFQSSANFAVAHTTTEVRFVFSIGSLDYTKAGFVFSFESYGDNQEPEVGADGCYVIEATAAHSVIVADGQTIPAPDGRWWIAGKITNIPQDEFCGWIYVRAFVTDGNGTRYSEVGKTNPYAINRGDGEKVREAIGKKSGTTSSSAKIEDKRNIYTDVLQSGAKTFHPTQENPEGNDLYVEYSFLLNKHLNKLNVSNKPYVVSSIGKNDLSDGGKPLCYWSPCDNVSGSACTTAGGFEDAGNFSTVAASDPGLFPNMVPPYGGDSSVFANYPHLGGSVALDPDHIDNGCEVGWHRIGLVYHEEVLNVDAVKGGADAEYYLTVSLYLDGTLVSVLCADDNVDAEHGNFDMKLYTAESDGNGGILYTDVASETDQYLYVYRMKYQGTSNSSPAYCVFADAYATCGKSFVQPVTPVEYPARSYYRADDEKAIFAPLYYRISTDDDPHVLLTVMSYNVGVYGGTSGNAGWEGRDPAKVAETILSESPDIVGLQEVNQKNANGWDATLNSLATSGGYTRLQGGYTGRYDFEKNEILYKTAKFTKLAEGTKTFRQTASELGVPNTEDADPDISNIDRVFHYAVLQEKTSGKNILVVNAHLHYGGTGSGHEEDDKLRRYEIAALLAWLETQRATYPDQIVLGDMNSHYKGGQGKVNMKLFEDGGFEKTCTDATVKGDVGGTLAENGRTTRPEWIFDYILTKGNLDAAYYTVVDNPIDEGDTYPSDHIPVLAKIYLR